MKSRDAFLALALGATVGGFQPAAVWADELFLPTAGIQAADRGSPEIDAIRQAPDPSAAVAAYGRAVAAGLDEVAVAEAYLGRMVELGVPEMAYTQASALTRYQPDNGLAWAVLAEVDARRDRPVTALGEIVTAARYLPDDAFVQQTAGQLLAWYDFAADRSQVPAEVRQSLGVMRRDLANEAAFGAAYRRARDFYREARTKPAPSETAVEPRVSAPVAPPPTNTYVYEPYPYVYPTYVDQYPCYRGYAQYYRPYWQSFEPRSVSFPRQYSYRRGSDWDDSRCSGRAGYRWFRRHDDDDHRWDRRAVPSVQARGGGDVRFFDWHTGRETSARGDHHDGLPGSRGPQPPVVRNEPRGGRPATGNVAPGRPAVPPPAPPRPAPPASLGNRQVPAAPAPPPHRNPPVAAPRPAPPRIASPPRAPVPVAPQHSPVPPQPSGRSGGAPAPHRR